jgi:hypothetical protein
MTRIGRIVIRGFLIITSPIPGFPHHVTQRGNRRQQVFFELSDYALYCDLLAERRRKASVEVWAYCLMPNHVHLVRTERLPERELIVAAADVMNYRPLSLFNFYEAVHTHRGDQMTPSSIDLYRRRGDLGVSRFTRIEMFFPL